MYKLNVCNGYSVVCDVSLYTKFLNNIDKNPEYSKLVYDNGVEAFYSKAVDAILSEYNGKNEDSSPYYIFELEEDALAFKLQWCM